MGKPNKRKRVKSSNSNPSSSNVSTNLNDSDIPILAAIGDNINNTCTGNTDINTDMSSVNKSDCLSNVENDISADRFQMIMSGIGDIKKTLDGVVNRLDTHDKKIKKIENKIEKVEVDLQKNVKVNAKLDSVIQESNNHLADITLLQEENKRINKDVDLLRAYAIRMEQRLEFQEKLLTDLQGRSMKENIVITGLEEKEHENLRHVVSDIFKKDLRHAMPVSNIQEVREGLLQILASPATASCSHNILAYRYVGPNGVINDGVEDDGEYGGGRCILNAMKEEGINNALVVVSRVFGQKLGYKRFSYFKNAARTALQKASSGALNN
ncbi:hypothetical protein KUTeg_024960 [Tegillarca granosa]|uniref:Impact N-terminal domain-containing protein n=1 Tax=Tegillarca granosa TaxID=220873 RepID=A0ABQ9DYQ5_TEGGR|nr:hypothetical protein KUTeg_024960 [Tegillarca granosa]